MKQKVTSDIISSDNEIKDDHIMIDGQTLLDQPVKNNFRTYKKLWLVRAMITQLVVY